MKDAPPDSAGTRQVRVATGARLHFGLLAWGGTGRQFGGVGLMIDEPQLEVRCSPAARDHIEAPPAHADRVRRLLEVWRATGAAPATMRPLNIEVRTHIVPHVGLGAGTQLALALGHCLAEWEGLSASAASLAMRLGRGARSSIGIHGFEQGGLLVEAGKLPSEQVAPLVMRVDLPAAWRMVLARPEDVVGVSGADEVGRFSMLPPTPKAATAELCRIALTELLPAVQTAHWPAAAQALEDYGRVVGSLFASVQGGLLSDPTMRLVAEFLGRRGIRGVAQSSWGPTLAMLQPDQESAQALAAALCDEFKTQRLRCQVVRAARQGATVSNCILE